ncbi:MAG: DUF4258 domain-containing protein [Chloroflexi bacterium]|nr:DUF4258 domain-containing protein [Chloroflexota bacterium]
MKSIETIRQQLAQGEFEFSRHAFRRAVERNISEAEIRQAGLSAQLIEDYPTDKYSPSCLLLGFTDEGKILHLQVSRTETNLTKIVTLYEPEPQDWDLSFTQRR